MNVMDERVQRVTATTIGCIIIVILGGCSAISINDTTTTTSFDTPQKITPTSTALEETATTTTGHQTVTERETTTKGIFHNEEYELKVRNPTNKTKRVTVEIAFENGTTVLDRSITVAGNSSVGFNLTFPHPDDYKIIAKMSGERAVQIWTVEVRDPAAVAVVWLEEENVDIGLYVA
jgi:hypothetical protein